MTGAADSAPERRHHGAGGHQPARHPGRLGRRQRPLPPSAAALAEDPAGRRRLVQRTARPRAPTPTRTGLGRLGARRGRRHRRRPRRPPAGSAACRSPTSRPARPRWPPRTARSRSSPRSSATTRTAGSIAAGQRDQYAFATAQALPALANVPAGTGPLTVSAPATAVEKSTVTVTVAGLGAGEAGCVSFGSVAKPVTGTGADVGRDLRPAGGCGRAHVHADHAGRHAERHHQRRR